MTAVVLRLGGSREYLLYFGVLVAGTAIDFVCARLPAELPFWMPWEFSWPVYLTFAFTIIWFARGLLAVSPGRRPRVWRLAAFLCGLLSFYVVLQTHFDYLAQHMFFMHRLAHFVLHHSGAFLIALGAVGPVLRAGMPDGVRRLLDSGFVRTTVNAIQHPLVAPVLFVGLLYVWLAPQIHTRVMLDRNLYDVMNWSMAIDGVFFWLLILDGRAKPPARLSFLVRFFLIIAIEIPQMLLGAVLSLSSADYYPVYRICGRIMNMTALNDQHYGGLIIWLPGTLMSFAAAIVVLLAVKKNEEETAIA